MVLIVDPVGRGWGCLPSVRLPIGQQVNIIYAKKRETLNFLNLFSSLRFNY